MEIMVLEESKKRMVFEVTGEGHTLCNAVKSQLNKDEHVKLATYTIRHPLIARPVMTVETDSGKTPQEAIANAAREFGEEVKDFKREFDKAVAK